MSQAWPSHTADNPAARCAIQIEDILRRVALCQSLEQRGERLNERRRVRDRGRTRREGGQQLRHARPSYW